jgi:hypothetical protein
MPPVRVPDANRAPWSLAILLPGLAACLAISFVGFMLLAALLAPGRDTVPVMPALLAASAYAVDTLVSRRRRASV